MQVRSVEPKEALRLQNENNFVILDVRPEAEFKEVMIIKYKHLHISEVLKLMQNLRLLWLTLQWFLRVGSSCRCY